LAGGITLAVFFPKLSKVLAHTLIGVTLMAVMGSIFLEARAAHGMRQLPGSLLLQGLALVGMVLLGAIVQWQITPPFRKAGSNAVPRI
jgi:hypothetical protein